MEARPASAITWLFDGRRGFSDRFIPRWIFLRGMGLVYLSAFYSLVFQIRGLIGPEGILPAESYLRAVAQSLGHVGRLWFAPSVLWLSSNSSMLVALCGAGLLASLLLIVNVWPRAMLLICFICFLSFVSAAQDFSNYQSDGMLLEAGVISLFFAPPGFRPGFGAAYPGARASFFLLLWEWFRIYFQSGVVKILSGDPQWRNYTAMDEYYQNGPLPTWIGWYIQHFPHWFHAATVFATLAMELGLIWMTFLPRRWRILLFFIVTFWQAGVILTANYAFLNYLVLLMGVLLLDDRFVLAVLPERWKSWITLRITVLASSANEKAEERFQSVRTIWNALKLSIASVILICIFYGTTARLLWMFVRLPLPTFPVSALEPFRIANQFGLFAVMTRGRYEIEFQGSQDGQTWVAYPFRYKPQGLNEPPGIYAPYQPRFDWNLWFASLGSWREYEIVPNTEIRLLSNDKDVLELFAGNPFATAPPRYIRAVIWQYWFTTRKEKRATGNWWRRQMLGLYAPTLERQLDGRIGVVEWPNARPQD